ncbi:MAG: aromatic ring-hydroxylating oxygenase subunit alpha [Gaiellales bacterium]
MSATRRRAKTTRPGGARLTLHAKAYADPAIFERERREVFARAWMIVGHVAEVAAPGDFAAGEIGGEPVVAVRGEDGVLRAFSNVCRHRAARLASGSGSCGKVLRCPYHGWTYRLDGTLAAMPEGRGFGEDFDRDDVRLPEFAVAELGGLVFVNMDPAAVPIRKWFGEELCVRLESLGIERLVPSTTRDWQPREILRGLPDVLRTRRAGDARALIPEARTARLYDTYAHNWKTLSDNYLEGYHVPIGHPGLLRLLDYPRYRATLYERGAWIDGPLRDNPSRDLLENLYQRLHRPMRGFPEELAGQWTYLHLWPGQFVDVYPESIDTWQMQPLAPLETRTLQIIFRSPDETLRDRAVRRINLHLNGEVMDEDVELCDGVQAGLGSLTYTRGVLNDNENAIGHFHDLLRAAVPGIDDPA